MSQSSPTVSRRHIPQLDGLRGIAVLLVLLTHLPATFTSHIHSKIPLLLNMGGYLGVDIFFALSGFLITRILLAEREREAPLRNFLFRRFLRIFPIYYLVILVHVLLRPGPELIWCASYLSNYYFAFDKSPHLLRHTWSLAVEEHFYLLWPLLVRWSSNEVSERVLKTWVLPASLVSGFAIAILGVPHAPSLIYSGTQSRIWSLGLGAAVAYSVALRNYIPRLRHIAATIALGVVFFVIGAATHWRSLTYALQVPAFSFLSLGCLFVALRSQRGTWPFVGLTNRPITFVGRVSYGLYLYHGVFYGLVFGKWAREFGLSNVTAAAAAVGSTFVVAVCSYFIVEKPILQLKSKFAAGRVLQDGAVGAQVE